MCIYQGLLSLALADEGHVDFPTLTAISEFLDRPTKKYKHDLHNAVANTTKQ